MDITNMVRQDDVGIWAIWCKSEKSFQDRNIASCTPAESWDLVMWQGPKALEFQNIDKKKLY